MNKIKVLFLYGGDTQYHNYNDTGNLIKNVLINNDFNVLLTDDFNMFLPENIKEFNVIVTYTVDAVITKKQADGFLNAVKNDAKGFVGLHGATTSFKNIKEYRKMIGASFINHPEFGPVYNFKITDRNHNITKGLSDFSLQDELYLFDIHSDFNTIITSTYENIERPIAWTKTYGKGKIFYLALGHGVDQLKNVNLQKLIVNGINWTGK